MSGLSDKSAFESFERMAERIEHQERKAIAAAEIQEEFSGDTLAAQFQVLEYKGSADQQLLELKAKMGMLGAAGNQGTRQIGKGGETVEAELVDDHDEGGTKP
jgi:phage shock protein A